MILLVPQSVAVARTIPARQTALRGVPGGAQRFQRHAVGGAKAKAEVITSCALTMTPPTEDGRRPSGGEHWQGAEKVIRPPACRENFPIRGKGCAFGRDPGTHCVSPARARRFHKDPCCPHHERPAPAGSGRGGRLPGALAPGWRGFSLALWQGRWPLPGRAGGRVPRFAVRQPMRTALFQQPVRLRSPGDPPPGRRPTGCGAAGSGGCGGQSGCRCSPAHR